MKEERQQLSDRLKKVPHFVEEQFTHLEQQPPNKPSFLLVVLLSGVTLIVLFLLAILILHLAGASITGHSFRRHPTSELVLPVSGPKSFPAQPYTRRHLS